MMQIFHNRFIIPRKWTQVQCSCLSVVVTCKHLHQFPGSLKDKKITYITLQANLEKIIKTNLAGNLIHWELPITSLPGLKSSPRHIFQTCQGTYSQICRCTKLPVHMIKMIIHTGCFLMFRPKNNLVP